MKLNRVWIAIILIFVCAAYYEVRLKPQSRPLYESALVQYDKGNYPASLRELSTAYQIEPNSTDILVLIGWNQLKLGRLNEAQANFARAARLNPNLVEARLGLDYVALESGNGEGALSDIRVLVKQEPHNRDFQLAAATAFRQAGQNQDAVAVFRNLADNSKLGGVARKNLLEMYGLGNSSEEIPAGLPPVARAPQLQVAFRANGKSLQRRGGATWENLYIKGVDLDPGSPAHFASEAPLLVEDYLPWLSQISALGANTIRVYAALPPAFYRALKRHNESSASGKLYLIQQLSLPSSEDADLFSASAQAAARQEISRTIDVVHGQGDLPMRKGYANGLYAVDVSDAVLGFLIGRDLPSHIVTANNELNAGKQSYSGKFISLPKGNPTEVWLAGLMDYAASYETDKYNVQRPLAFSSNSALDPLKHPTESSLREEIDIRRNEGERSASVPPPGVIVDDDDAVSIDETLFQSGANFQSGIFAAYSVFPFHPDFMFREPAYTAVKDSQGANPFFGYVKALKEHYANMPLLIQEYGIPTSMGVSHINPFGWSDGGLNEREQGEALSRMTRNIADAGCAGGLIFEWSDEWYKADWLSAAMEIPADRRSLWNNRLDSAQGFGLQSYDPPADASLFSGFTGWSTLHELYSKNEGPEMAINDGWDAERTLRSLTVSSDAAFVYLRLQLGALRKGPQNIPDMKGANYYIGISTAPGRFGGQVLPGILPEVSTDGGANFLLHISDAGHALLLIASNYNPRTAKPIFASVPSTRIGYRLPYEPKMDKWSPFEEIVVEPNGRRYSRDGRAFPAQVFSQSELHYRAPGAVDNSNANWTCDFDHNAMVFRIPWASLMLTDPSSHRVLSAAQSEGIFESIETPGLQFFAVSFRPDRSVQFQQRPTTGVPVADSLPLLSEGAFVGLKNYSWQGWNEVKAPVRLKSSFAAVQKIFHQL